MIREDWTEVGFDELVSNIPTSNNKVKQREYLQKGLYPVIDQGQELIGGYIDDEKIVDCDLPVIVFGDHTKIVKYINFKFARGADGTKIFEPKRMMEPKYLYYITKFLAKKIEDRGYARHYQYLRKEKVFVAPLPEQRAIVSKIEELFSELDSGIDNLNKAKKQLEVYRQAVLKSAFEGKLTKEWREDNSIKFSDWNYYKIGEIIETIDGDRGKNYPKKHEYMDDGYCLFLSTKNVLKGAFNFEDTTFISKGKDEILRGGKLERKDVVITTRGTLGNVAHYDDKVPYKNIRINSGMLILRIKDHNFLNAIFLMRFINSSLFIQQLRRKQSGTAQPQIPAGVLKEIEIMVPNRIDEQEEIIKEIESRISVCENIEANIDEALEKSEALRHSILKKAFEGKLLSREELEACKQEDDWEPADKLLKRIKEAAKEVK